METSTGTYTVGPSAVATLLVSAGDGSTLISNLSLTTILYLGDNNGIKVGEPSTVQVEPNGSRVVDGSIDIYGTASSNILVSVLASGAASFRGLTQAQGNLAIPSMQSPNYLAGVNGWAIFQNGSAEFNNLTVRGNQVFPNGWISNGDGTYTNRAGIFLYNGTPAAGNMTESVASTAGTDKFGNTFVAGHANYDLITSNAIAIDQGQILWYTASVPQPGSTYSLNVQLAQNTVNSGITFINFNSTSELLLDSNGLLHIICGADPNSYIAGKQTLNTGLTHITSTSAQLIRRVNVQIGYTYHYKITMMYVGLQAAGAPVISHGGTATFSHVKGWTNFDFGTARGVFPDQVTLPSRTGPTLTVGNTLYQEEFWLTCSGTGTIDFSGADSIASDNWDALQTFSELEPIA